jgi:hypothetical protein
MAARDESFKDKGKSRYRASFMDHEHGGGDSIAPDSKIC